MPAAGGTVALCFFFFEEIGKCKKSVYRVERGRGVRGVKRSERQAEAQRLPDRTRRP
jgi:hypothetical protein